MGKLLSNHTYRARYFVLQLQILLTIISLLNVVSNTIDNNYILLDINIYSPHDLNTVLITQESATKNDYIYLNIMNTNLSSDIIGRTIDEFLTPRPWWYMVNEIYEWDTSNHYILLRRFDRKFDSALYQITSIHYPSKCNHLHLHISYAYRFDSLGQTFNNLLIPTYINQWSLTVPYLIDPTVLQTSYLDMHSCPDIENKYLCIFLPFTNCDIPQTFKNLIDKYKTDPQSNEDIFEGQQYYSQASSDAQPIASNDFHDIIRTQRDKLGVMSTSIPLTTYYFYDLVSNTFEIERNTTLDLRSHLAVHGTFYRFNYKFRSHIAEYIRKEFNTINSKLPPFPSNGDCIAAHIRRTDRIPSDDPNATHWCYTHRAFPENRTCLNQETQQYYEDYNDCKLWPDYGCNLKRPFGSITVQEVLSIAKLLKHTNNVLLVSDDGEYVSNELSKINDDRNIYVLPAPQNHRKYSTKNGISYFASIHMFQQCSALIGVGNSAVTTFILHLMCVRHGNTYGQCPPFYDFGGSF
jgi:hypothetical protein